MVDVESKQACGKGFVALATVFIATHANVLVKLQRPISEILELIYFQESFSIDGDWPSRASQLLV